MPQINLLSNETKEKSLPVGRMLTLFARLFALVFFVVIIYYGYLWYQSKSAANDILAKQNNIIKMQNEVLDNRDRKELLTRQGQLQQLDKLLGSHPYWSKLFPELARVTLKSAYYTALTASGEGAAKMTVIVPTYSDFNNFLSVFDRDEFNKQFSNVAIGSVNKYQVGGTTGIKFDVELKYNTDFLKQSSVK